MSLVLTESYNAHHSYYSSCSTDSAVFDQEDSSAHCSSPSSSTAPSIKDSIADAVDTYMRAAKAGRTAFLLGNIKLAAEQFAKALDLELRMETECLCDTTIGVVSGVVRKEVEGRLSGKSLGPSFNRVLKNLRAKYCEAEKKVRSKPTEAKWYLKMGSILCCVNQWERAKEVYRRGLELCKVTKGLAAALQKLVELEQRLSLGAAPPLADSADGDKRDLVSSFNTLPDLAFEESAEHQPSTRFTTMPSVTKAKRKRFSIARLRSKSKRIQPSTTKLSSAISSGSSFSGSQGDIDPFSAQSPAIVISLDCRPSVIVLLRSLSMVSPETLQRICSHGVPSRTRFASAPPVRPLVIDTDDSELDD